VDDCSSSKIPVSSGSQSPPSAPWYIHLPNKLQYLKTRVFLPDISRELIVWGLPLLLHLQCERIAKPNTTRNIHHRYLKVSHVKQGPIHINSFNEHGYRNMAQAQRMAGVTLNTLKDTFWNEMALLLWALEREGIAIERYRGINGLKIVWVLWR